MVQKYFDWSTGSQTYQSKVRNMNRNVCIKTSRQPSEDILSFIPNKNLYFKLEKRLNNQLQWDAPKPINTL